MTINTINHLNQYADVIANTFYSAAKCGCLCKDPENDHTDKFTSIKKSISVGKDAFQAMFGINLVNVLKTTQQYNYLTNEVLVRLQRHGFFHNDFQNNVTTAKYTRN